MIRRGYKNCDAKITDNILFFNLGITTLSKGSKASFEIIEIKEGNINSRVVPLEN